MKTTKEEALERAKALQTFFDEEVRRGNYIIAGLAEHARYLVAYTEGKEYAPKKENMKIVKKMIAFTTIREGFGK